MPTSAFSPGRTQTVSVGTTSSSISLDRDAPVVQFMNTGTQPVFVRCGTGPQTATLNDYPVLPNIPQYITKGVGADTLAMIDATGGSTPTLYVTTGSMG